MTTIEALLYAAWAAGRGVRLYVADVKRLVSDDAIGTRITDEARRQAGVEPCGMDGLGVHPASSWAAFVRRIKRSEG